MQFSCSFKDWNWHWFHKFIFITFIWCLWLFYAVSLLFFTLLTTWSSTPSCSPRWPAWSTSFILWLSFTIQFYHTQKIHNQAIRSFHKFMHQFLNSNIKFGIDVLGDRHRVKRSRLSCVHFFHVIILLLLGTGPMGASRQIDAKQEDKPSVKRSRWSRIKSLDVVCTS